MFVFFPLQLSYVMFSCIVLTHCGFFFQCWLSKLTRIPDKYCVSKRKHYIPKCKSFPLIALGCCEPACGAFQIGSKWWKAFFAHATKKKKKDELSIICGMASSEKADSFH